MKPEAVTSTLLNVGAITAIVGNRIALAQLPENSAYPALVYNVISDVPMPPINAQAGGTLVQCRMQITALARTLSDVKSILEAVRQAMNYRSGTIASTTVVSIVRVMATPYGKDDEASVFYQSADYMITYYES
jgi:hypothetical protein